MATWVAQIGPVLTDYDCVHASSKQRSAKSHAPVLQVLPPPPTAIQRSLERADLAVARDAQAGGVQH
eukprot:2359097-Pyramimonas_sp.AAC.1